MPLFNSLSSKLQTPTSNKKQKNDDYLNSLWNDDMYLAELERYRNNPWFDESRYMNNPYLASRIGRYTPDFLTGLFNYEAGAAEYYDSYKTRAFEELAKIDTMAREEYYNSASQQVARERAAGLNPDLNGNITPGEASQDDNLTPSDIRNGTGANMAIQTSNAITGVGEAIIRTAFSVVTGLQGIKGVGLDNAVKSLDLNEHFRGSARSFIQDGISEFLEGNVVNPEQMSKPEFVNSTVSYFLDRLKKSPFSKREKRHLIPLLEQMIKSTGESGQAVFTNDFERLLSSSFGSLADSRADATEAFGRVGSNNETISATKLMADKIYKPINEINNQVTQLIAKYNKGFYSVADGKVKAESENAGYSMQKDLLDVKKRMNAFFEEIDKAIDSSDIGPRWKLGLRSGVASAQSLWITQLNQGLHFGFSSSEGSSQSFNRRGDSYSSHSSRSWHF